MDYCYYVDPFSGISRLGCATHTGTGDWWHFATIYSETVLTFLVHGDELHACPL